LEHYAQDLEKAQALLTQVGETPTLRIAYIANNVAVETQALIIPQELKAVGIAVELHATRLSLRAAPGSSAWGICSVRWPASGGSVCVSSRVFGRAARSIRVTRWQNRLAARAARLCGMWTQGIGWPALGCDQGEVG
jgi:hypothetical protein